MGNFKFDLELAQKLLAEFTGTAMVLALGCTLSLHATAGSLALGWGLIYLAAIHTFTFLSGAHLNPAVSATATIVGVMEWQMMLCYMLAQLLGAVIGFGMSFVLKAKAVKFMCLTAHGKQYEEMKTIGVELFMMMALLFAYCGIWDKRSEGAYDSVSARVGFIIAALYSASLLYTQCSLNLFRTLAPALVQCKFEGLWPFVVAHILAVVIVGLIWRFVIAEGEPEPME